jgi:hypothetical protein
MNKNTSSLTKELKEGAANEKYNNFGDILQNANRPAASKVH